MYITKKLKSIIILFATSLSNKDKQIMYDYCDFGLFLLPKFRKR